MNDLEVVIDVVAYTNLVQDGPLVLHMSVDTVDKCIDYVVEAFHQFSCVIEHVSDHEHMIEFARCLIVGVYIFRYLQAYIGIVTTDDVEPTTFQLDDANWYVISRVESECQVSYTTHK